MYFTCNNQKGFTLIEALIAIFIFSVALVSLVTITSRGVTGTAQSRDQAIAQFLAQEGIELMRNFRDTEIIDGNNGLLTSIMPQCQDPVRCSISFSSNYGFNNSGSYGLEVLSNNRYEAVSAGRFYREIYFTDPSPRDEIEVHSVVTWTNGSIPRSVHLVTTLTNWGQATP